MGELKYLIPRRLSIQFKLQWSLGLSGDLLNAIGIVHVRFCFLFQMWNVTVLLINNTSEKLPAQTRPSTLRPS